MALAVDLLHNRIPKEWMKSGSRPPARLVNSWIRLDDLLWSLKESPLLGLGSLSLPSLLI